MDMYLFTNFQTRAVLVGQREHPFLNYPRLAEYWQQLGETDWHFDPSNTFAMLNKIEANGHAEFHQELVDLLWFGGIMSYGNIMRETYAIIYNWIHPDDLADVEGLCEEDDGVTFRKIIQSSLRIVRVNHTQELISRQYEKLASTKLVMRQSGMAAYFAKINKIRLELKKHGEILTDALLLHTTYKAVVSRHKQLNDAVSELRRKAGVSGIPTTFAKAKAHLLDTFDFQIPIADKSEKSVPTNVPTVPAKIAGDADASRKRPPPDADDDKKGPGKKKKKYPKGSCIHCPNATSHLTKFCYKELRKRMGLPPGWSWCTAHKNCAHYDHCCRRHAPNYPAPPKITSAKTANVNKNEDLRAKIGAMLGIPNLKKKPKGITIESPDGEQNFHPACSTLTKPASKGPPVANILGMIMKLSEKDRQELAKDLVSAGL